MQLKYVVNGGGATVL